VSLFPAGATRGKTTECKVSGRNLNKVDRWLVSGQGVAVVEAKTSSDSAATIKLAVDEKAESSVRELRAIGPTGISNMLLIRVDHLAQSAEAEPNDDQTKPTPVAMNSAVAGTLKPQDLDYFSLQAKAGTKATIEVEAQRLGTSLVPVLTVMTPSGASLAQARQSKGTDRDCRVAFTFPADGTYLILVHDNTYNGVEGASYRLRVEEAPFATGVFPLGGPRGQPLAVSASGGSLPGVRTKTVILPDSAGATIDSGWFDGPEGPVFVAAKLVAGDEPQVLESPADERGESHTSLPSGATANGRISRPNEVDRYTIDVKKGEPILLRIKAASLGSWLDSVVTLRDEKGLTLAENDDPVDSRVRGNQILINNINVSSPDSRLDYEPKADGRLTVEVTDRYGDGGPEYAYRLEFGPAQPDFTISLLFGDPLANQRVLIAAQRQRAGPTSPGVLNLKPGSSTPVNFLINSEGKTGPIEVTAEGLPAGVTAQKVTINAPGASRNQRVNRPIPPSGGAIVLKVASDAPAGTGEMRLVAVAKLTGGGEIRRTASVSIPVDNLPLNGPAVRPVMRNRDGVPVCVVGSLNRPDATAALAPLVLNLRGLNVPAPLLQGNRIDVELEFDDPLPDPDRYTLSAETDRSSGLATQSLPPDTSSPNGRAQPTLGVVAAVDAEPGAKTVKITLQPDKGTTLSREFSVLVRAPIRVQLRREPIELAPGGTASVSVLVVREIGFKGPVDFRFLNLPEGVSVSGGLLLPAGKDCLEVRLTMAETAPRITDPLALQVVGVVRMPRGPVRVEAANRPMLLTPKAEK
jgi:hypothetical protein